LWSVGIRHPRGEADELIDSLRVTDQAVCTSGEYERGRHIIDARTGESPTGVASVTVIASGAMLADALATAAFVMGPREGIQFLERMGVEGLMFTHDLVRYETRGLSRAA
jgi:thiamine biosynthesis lipoprotein